MVSAQDAVKTDPKHYTVVSENDQVRILKVHYGPHEKSIMHSHPATVAVFLTHAKGQFSFPAGKKTPFAVKAGDAQYDAATVHLPEKHRRRRDGCDCGRTERPCGQTLETGKNRSPPSRRRAQTYPIRAK
jgi:hypothetical protein